MKTPKRPSSRILWVQCTALLAVAGLLGCSSSNNETDAAGPLNEPLDAAGLLPSPDGAPSNLVAMYADAQVRIKQGTPGAYAKLAEASFNVFQYQSQQSNHKEAREYAAQAAIALRHAIESKSPGLPPKKVQTSVLFAAAGAHAASSQSTEAIENMAMAAQFGLPLDELEKLERDSIWSAVTSSDGYQAKYESWLQMAAARELASSRKRMPVSIQGSSLSGTPINTADFLGSPTVLFLWGSWSEASQGMLPAISQLAEKGTKVVGIMYEEGDNDEVRLAAAKNAVDNMNVRFPCILGSEEVTAILRRFTPLANFPKVVYVDGEGIARHATSGAYSASYVNAVANSLSEL